MNDETRILITRLFQIPKMDCYSEEQKYERAEQLIREAKIAKAVGHDLLVSEKFAEEKSVQPMKDFEKEFLYNWTIDAIKDDKDLFYRVKQWIGEWYENNVSKFSR